MSKGVMEVGLSTPIFVTMEVQDHSETNTVGCLFFLLQRAFLQNLAYTTSPRYLLGLFWGSGLTLDLLHDWQSACVLPFCSLLGGTEWAFV